MTSPDNEPFVGVHIAAAGQGSRLRRTMDAMGLPPEYPKHLLPTGGPDGETLLGRITRQALEIPSEKPPLIYASPENFNHIEASFDIPPSAGRTINNHHNWMYLFGAGLRATNNQLLGTSGDYYAEFDWADMLGAHEESAYPVSFLVAQTVPVDKGAVYDIDDNGQITGLTRKDRTSESDYINIGAYIFDAEPMVLKIFEQAVANRQSEEEVARTLVHHKLVGAYAVELAFNVNTPETYEALLIHTKQHAKIEQAA